MNEITIKRSDLNKRDTDRATTDKESANSITVTTKGILEVLFNVYKTERRATAS